MLGTCLLFSYEVMGSLPEVLRCKPGGLVKGFISTPSVSKTMYSIASSHGFSSKGTHYSRNYSSNLNPTSDEGI